MAMSIRSPAFTHQSPIPARYTCEGDDVSPPLELRDPPAGTRSLALIVDDPDAPDPAQPKRTWVHWVLYNLPPSTRELAEALHALPDGARAGHNDWGKARYGGPCPPVGRHRYFFKLFALDTELPDLGHPTAASLQAAMEGHVLGQATLMGTYQKAR